MSAEKTTASPETAPTKSELQYGDVLLVVFAVAVIVFGNVAIVRAMDIALDNIAR